MQKREQECKLDIIYHSANAVSSWTVGWVCNPIPFFRYSLSIGCFRSEEIACILSQVFAFFNETYFCVFLRFYHACCFNIVHELLIGFAQIKMADGSRDVAAELEAAAGEQPEVKTEADESALSPRDAPDTEAKTAQTGAEAASSDGQLSVWDTEKDGPRPVIKSTDMRGEMVYVAAITAARAIQKGRADKKVGCSCILTCSQ